VVLRPHPFRLCLALLAAPAFQQLRLSLVALVALVVLAGQEVLLHSTDQMPQACKSSRQDHHSQYQPHRQLNTKNCMDHNQLERVSLSYSKLDL